MPGSGLNGAVAFVRMDTFYVRVGDNTGFGETEY